MMKKLFKIIAAVAAVLLIIGLLFIYNAFCGNIFSAMYAKHQIEQYINENFTDNSYQISNAQYNFKMGTYVCNITDPNSADGSFTASYSEGEVYDDYDIMVTQKQNIIMRLEEGFRNDVGQILDNYLTEPDFGFGTIIYGDSEIDTSKLSLDMTFDTKNMPMETCIVAVMYSDETTSFNKIKQLISDLQRMDYRIDYCEYSDKNNCYEKIPVNQLMEAESSAELAAYRLTDDEKEPEIE